MCLLKAPKPEVKCTTPLVDIPKPARKKLWELNKRLLCPIIGTCLSTRELRRFATRYGMDDINDWSDYQIHVFFVSKAETRDTTVKKLHKQLDKKYAPQVKAYQRLTSAPELIERWQEDVKKGDIAGAFWATATHTYANYEIETQIYETVHMISHQQGAAVRSDLRQHHELESELQQILQDAQDNTERYFRNLKQRDAKINELEKTLKILQQQYLAIKNKQLSQLAHTDSEPKQRKMEQQLERLEKRCVDKDETIARLSEALYEAKQTNQTLEQENRGLTALFETPVANDSSENKTKAMPKATLAGSKVLCVGGRSAQEPRYREVVDRCNGCLLLHDGGQEQSLKQLDAMLEQADAVICPTDCVSHNAYYRTKNYCKKTGTPCIFLASSSNSAFASGVQQLSGKILTQG